MSSHHINIYYTESSISLLIKLITMIKKENHFAKILIIFFQQEELTAFDKFLWTKALWLPHCKLNDDMAVYSNIILTDINNLPLNFNDYNYHFVIDEEAEDTNNADFYNNLLNYIFNKLCIISSTHEDLKKRYYYYLDLKKNNFIIKLFKEDSNGIFSQLN